MTDSACILSQPQAQKTLADWEALLPEAPKPVGSYLPCVQSGALVYTSGALPMKEGQLLMTGAVGDHHLSIEQAQTCARQCILNLLGVLKAQLGSLFTIKRVVKMTAFVMSAPGFDRQPLVANAASDLLAEVFGPEIGRHARSAVGVNQLPLNAPVEIELIVEVA